ncbi:MAG: hypothetical protein JKY27_07750 [Magnetovibrio sp.]|nr:hypothetical protein [Magnetovibrio sp.]
MINRRHFMMLGAVLAPSACATDAPIAGPVPEVGFQHLAPVRLNVSIVEVQSSYQSPMKAPNAEHRFATPPAQAMMGWAKSRLRAVGGSGNGAVATFIVEDAKVIETKLKKTEGFKGFFTYEPTERYDATAVARLLIENSETGSHGEIEVNAARSIEISENATLSEREQAWFSLTETLMADFNAQMEKQIGAHLSQWLDPPVPK